ncbi:hypothetical protein ACIA5E_21790 [Nocardia asteroides]|uniref:hypothetical protein n=1 Tax=Nocardia asteroides TaxID=1824 RepID=UPI0037A7F4D3
MVFDAHVLKVLIASPGDTTEERAAVADALHGWNGARSEREQVFLFPWLWEKHAVPRLGGSPQSMINAQAVDSADIVIALFDSRLGTATDDAVSGTAEEIKRAHEAGKPVHVWFSQEPLPRDVDTDQLNRLRQFKAELEGLLGEYANPADLAYRVRDAIEDDLKVLGLGAVGPIKRGGGQAIPVARFVSERQPNGFDSKGKPKYRTRERLVVKNESSTTTAEQLTLDISEIADYVFEFDAAPFDLHPMAELQWIMGTHSGTPLQASVTLRWQEDGEVRERKQPISLSS